MNKRKMDFFVLNKAKLHKLQNHLLVIRENDEVQTEEGRTLY